MKIFPLLLTLTAVQVTGSGCYGAPVSATDAVLVGEIDIRTNEEIEISTEEPAPRKCNFGGATYTHSQMIPSNDPCSHCLCVAGEIYCWWQDRFSYSLKSAEDYENYFDANSRSTEFPVSGLLLNLDSSLGANFDNDTTTTVVSELSAQITDEEGYTDVNSTYQDFKLSQSTPSTSCVVMGIEYKEGEILPHTTGNCVQCGCSAAGRVECSPQDCVPLQQPPSGAGVDLSRGMDEIF